MTALSLEPTTSQEEIRHRVMEAAGEIFAEGGYQAATVRDICARAGVNIAAINYYFGDKLGLYTEALKTAVARSQRAEWEVPTSPLPPEQMLRHFLLHMLRSMIREDRPVWHSKVMIHELAQPTPALAVAVEQVIRPKAKIVCEIIAHITGRTADDLTTRLCAQSVMGQVVHCMHARPVMALLWPELKATSENVERLAEHITNFSLRGLEAFKQKSATPKATAKVARRKVAPAPAIKKSDAKRIAVKRSVGRIK